MDAGRTRDLAKEKETTKKKKRTHPNQTEAPSELESKRKQGKAVANASREVKLVVDRLLKDSSIHPPTRPSPDSLPSCGASHGIRVSHSDAGTGGQRKPPRPYLDRKL